MPGYVLRIFEHKTQDIDTCVCSGTLETHLWKITNDTCLVLHSSGVNMDLCFVFVWPHFNETALIMPMSNAVLITQTIKWTEDETQNVSSRSSLSKKKVPGIHCRQRHQYWVRIQKTERQLGWSNFLRLDETLSNAKRKVEYYFTRSAITRTLSLNVHHCVSTLQADHVFKIRRKREMVNRHDVRHGDRP